MTKAAAGRVLYLEIAGKLEAAIMSGEWKPGDRLPPLADLATHFSVSRAVIREACSVLVGSGILELKHGDGTYVRALPMDTVLRPLHAALLLGASNLRDLLETGQWIEEGIAAAAARRRTESHSQRLARALLLMESALGESAAVWAAEREFHAILAEASGNRMGENLLRILYHSLSSVLELVGKDRELQETAVMLHRALLDSVLRMDEAAAMRQIALYRSTLRNRVYALRDLPLEL